MSKLIDMTGKRIGRLTVVEQSVSSTTNGKAMWVCRCDCGNVIEVMGVDLRRGHTKSCGCINHDFFVDKNTTHGLRHHPLYEVWGNMKTRCNNPNNDHYKYYGGRGISVCDRWADFFNFYTDMIHGYKRGLQIDRINVNGNYDPSNCRWVTQVVNARNTRRNRYLTFNNETKSMAEWSDIVGLDQGVIKMRLRRGWTISKALSTPLLRQSRKSEAVKCQTPKKCKGGTQYGSNQLNT